ncbi:hypothetical protein GOB15_18605 [Sinorhizobium meliloti]|nr:hypothetical protein [Sinorhizobium meliloti]MDW9513278.1 hypothetical protein [Sinorhizobium meliloti]
MSTCEHHLANIPHLAKEERDADRYLRAFAAMIARLDDDAGGVCDIDEALEAAEDAIRFIADDAFRRGFEACHSNVVVPLRESSVSRETAVVAVTRYGERVRQGIANQFEDGPAVPTSISVAVEEMTLPPTDGILP